MKIKFLLANMRLVLLGIALGLLVRFTFGDPATENGFERKFNEPLDVNSPEPPPPPPDFPIKR